MDIRKNHIKISKMSNVGAIQGAVVGILIDSISMCISTGAGFGIATGTVVGYRAANYKRR